MSATHQHLDLHSAEPGVYAVRSPSPTTYLLHVASATRVMRAYVGGNSQCFTGDNQWWPLVELTSGPDLRGDSPQPTDLESDVVRVGSRHRYVWDPGTFKDDQWRIGRAVDSIEGPLTHDELAHVLGQAMSADPREGVSAADANPRGFPPTS